MVEDEEILNNKKTGFRNGLFKNVVLNTIENLENITFLDLSNRNISSFSEDLKLPQHIVHLNISKNKLTEVPLTVLNLDNLKTLDLSFNSVVFFDDLPNFCHTIEQLNLSNNKLEGPPLWVWTEKPKQLSHLNISSNKNICQSFIDGYFEELLQYTTLVNEIVINNCKLSKYLRFIATFCHAKVVCLGSEHYDISSVNYLEEIPCPGLDECCDIEKLNLSNTQIYNMNSNIDIYKLLKELNLAQNNINSLPNEFCNLENLESCILSCNKLLYLPDDMVKLKKLIHLHLDNNELCMLPENLHEIPTLSTLDLYNNNLCDGLDSINNLNQVDFAQNYFEEPNNEDYLEKKEKLRLNCFDRVDGRKIEAIIEDSEYSRDETDDEELNALNSTECTNQDPPNLPSRLSTPEDWDSDDYWLPQYYKPVTPPRSPWLYFVKKKMEEGNFCPMDAHPISIAEKVKYEKMCHPKIEHESDGQFDDYSDDDS